MCVRVCVCRGGGGGRVCFLYLVSAGNCVCIGAAATTAAMTATTSTILLLLHVLLLLLPSTTAAALQLFYFLEVHVPYKRLLLIKAISLVYDNCHGIFAYLPIILDPRKPKITT